MKKQSILAILIAALLVLTVFTGCAANSKMAPADPGADAHGQAPEPDVSQKLGRDERDAYRV